MIEPIKEGITGSHTRDRLNQIIERGNKMQRKTYRLQMIIGITAIVLGTGIVICGILLMMDAIKNVQ
jgi:hypothetical protein